MTGVPVKLTAIDPNGNVIDVGTATSNAYYGTFSFAWKPEISGTYTIMASFAGDDSYGSSGASTAIVVGAVPTVAPTATPTSFESINSTLMTGFIILAVLIVIALIILGVLLLRKR
jgi:hypothetical protein